MTTSAGARAAWINSNRTRLTENPELASAVYSGGMDYATARRVDMAYQANRAQQKRNTIRQSGLSEQYVHPTDNAAAQSADHAQRNWWQKHFKSGSFWDIGKGILGAGADALQVAMSPLTAPEAAGAAKQNSGFENFLDHNWYAKLAPLSGLGLLGAAVDWGRGVGAIAGGGISGEQKADMVRAGYEPDDWTSRYAWYMDRQGSAGMAVSDRLVGELKQDYDPGKVDIAREIVTSGVFEDMSRVEGLSPNAQKMLNAITANQDKEGAEVVKRLADRMQLTVGGQIAERWGLDPGSTQYDVVASLGELAVEWYLGPEIVAGKALKELRYMRYGAQLEPESVKAALVADGVVARRLDDALENVDTIYHLDQAGDVAGVAREKARFDRIHASWAPHYDLLYGMRQGSITGSFFGKPAIAESSGKSLDDMLPIQIRRVTNPSRFKPVFELRKNAGDAITDVARGDARAAIADRIGDAIIAHQVGTGTPIVHNRMLLPGQVRVSSRVRQAIDPLIRATSGSERGLLKQLDSVKGNVISLQGGLTTNADGTAQLLTSRQAGTWLREHYTVKGGLRARMARNLSRLRVIEDGATINFTDSASAKRYGDFIRFFMPKAQSDFLTHAWASSSPAQRKVMLESTFGALANARLAKSNPRSSDFWNQALKGQESVYKPGEPVKEAYSTPATDLIPLEGGDTIAAAMVSTQFARGVHLPTIKEIVQNTERVGLFGLLVGGMNSRVVDLASQMLKAGWVATTSNMQRQLIEVRGTQFLESPMDALRTTGARIGLAGKIAGARAETNQAIRDAKRVVNTGEGDELAKLIFAGDTNAYLKRVGDLIGQDFGSKRVGRIGAMLESGLDVREIANIRSRGRITATWPVDLLRRVREYAYGPLSRKYVDNDKWAYLIDTDLAVKMHEGMLRAVGGAADHYAHGSGLARDADQVNDIVSKGHALSALHLRNTFGYLGVHGDRGAQRWADAMNMRLSDPLGNMVMRAIAIQVLSGKSAKRKRLNHIDISKRRMPQLAGAPAVTVEDLAYHALSKLDEGKSYRLDGMRATVLGGKAVKTPAEFEEALRVWAINMVDDHGLYMGGKRLQNGDWVFDASHFDMLRQIANGAKHANLKTLSRIADEFRPEQVHSRILVPKKILELDGEDWSQKLSNMTSKMYRAVVAAPLERMALEPAVLAARHQALELMRPLAENLEKRGMSPETIQGVLDGNAYRYAVNHVFRYSDNPGKQTYFSALANNFLFFERAMEDFARRMATMTRADPAILGRALVMTEAAEHSGILHRQKGTDEDGNTTSELVFTYPGSGLIAKAVVNAGKALGIGESDLLATPYWTDFSSPVRYLSPSLANPLGFTTSPLIGMPLRAARSVFPEQTFHIDSALATMEGGERSLAGQGWVESFLPVPLRRAYNTYLKGDESQVASALRNAMIYMDAAGKLPGPESTDEEQQEALDTLRQQVVNVMTLRTIFATFTPAAPGTMGSDPSGLGEVNIVDALRGVNSVRGEWFTLLEDMTNRYGPDRAFSEASAEWLRRKEGSVINPVAFMSGSSRAPGAEQEVAGFPSSEELTQWMLNNRAWIKEHGDAAYKLLPSLGGKYYDAIAYRVQLRTGLRKHRDAGDMYKSLIYNQAQSDWYARKSERDDALVGANTAEAAQIWSQWNRFDKDMEVANPVWATMRAEKYTPEQVHSNIAPNVQKIADDKNLPAELKELQPDIRVMAALYDEYRTKSTEVTARSGDAFTARRNLNARYRARGDMLFKGTRLEALWNAMAVREDE